MLKWSSVCIAVLACVVLGYSLVPGDARRVQVSVVADIPLNEAWAILQDFSLAHNYVPGLSKTEIVSKRRSGVGAHRKVYDNDGGFLEETIIDWREGEGFVIRLHEGDDPMMPFKRVEFSYQLVAGETGQTLIVLVMVYEMPLGYAGEKLGQWFIEAPIEDNLVQVAAGMKYFYETGTPATDHDRERLAGEVEVLEK